MEARNCLINILNYLLNEYGKYPEERIRINLEFRVNGYVRIDAIGSCFQQFCINNFMSVQKPFITRTTTIYTKNKKYDFKNGEYSSKETIKQSLDTLDDVDYNSFVLNIGKTPELPDIMTEIKLHLKKRATEYPNIKMSLRGDVKLLQEYKYIKMIDVAMNDLLKYECSVQFRDQFLKQLNVTDKHEAIEIVTKKLSEQLKNIDD